MKRVFFYCLGVVLLCSSCNCKNEELYDLYAKELEIKVNQFHMGSVRKITLLNGKLDLSSTRGKSIFKDNCQRVQKSNILYTEGEKTASSIKLASSKDEAMQHINTFIAVVQGQLGGEDVGSDLLLKRLKKNEIDSNIEYRILFLRYVYDVLKRVAGNVGDPYLPLPGPSRPCN